MKFMKPPVKKIYNKSFIKDRWFICFLSYDVVLSKFILIRLL